MLAIGSFLSMDMYVSSFPALAHHFSVKMSSVQLSISIFVLSFAVSQLLSGVLSDHVGRRPVLLFGVMLYIIGSLITLFSPSMLYFNLGRVVQGLGIGAATSLARIILSDVFDGQALAKTLSLLSSCIVLAPAVAPFFGGLLQYHFGYLGSLIVMFLYGCGMLGLIIFVLPETNKTPSLHVAKPQFLRNVLKKMRNRKFILLSTVNGLAFAMVLAYTTITPFIFHHDFHYSSRHIGFILLMMAFGTVVGSLLNYKLLNHISVEKLVVLGLLISIMSNGLALLLALIGAVSSVCLILFIFAVNLGVGLVLGNNVTLIFRLFETEKGQVGAIYGFIRMGVSGIIAVAISALHLVGVTDMVVLMLGANLVALLVYFVGVLFCSDSQAVLAYD